MAQVAPFPISPPPGVVKNESERLTEGRWVASDMIRFFNGRPEKRGGWLKAVVTPTSGVPRAIHAWRDNAANNFMGAGTYRKLYVYDESWIQVDVTPYRLTGTLSNPFTTTSGSATVSVLHTAHGLSAGDTVIYSGAVAFAGITISGAYIVDSVADANHYTFTHTVAASSDGNDSFTKVLLHCDGADASTTFTDSNLGGSAHTWTANGNAQIDTADSKFSGASGLFDGAGDYADTPDHANYDFGSGELTIDSWFKIAAADVGGTQLLMAGQCDAVATATSISFFIERQAANDKIRALFGIGAGNVSVQSTATYTGSTNPGWHHLAVVRSGTTLLMFIDGVQQGAGTAMVGTVNNSTNKLAIGRGGEIVAAAWNGWIDEFRISVGVARWTTAFTAPTSFYGVPNGGTAVAYSYEIPIGTEVGTYGLGWGVSGWGLGTWGTAHSSSTIFIEPRIWSLDHFGQILLAGYNGGTIYSFDPTATQPWGRAQIITNAPDDVRSFFITPERFVIALRDGMVVHGSSQSDYTLWTPASSNTAFTRTVTEGTKLVAGKVLGPFTSLIWTDGALYLAQYTGNQFVYNISLAGKDCGLIAPNAAITVDGIAYWMGRKDFWMFDGSIHRMPGVNDITRHVFDNLNDQALFQCHAVYCPDFNEIEFFWTVIGQTSPTMSVIYSIDDKCWAPNVLTRVSGTHFTQGDTRPYMGGADGYIYQHEVGHNADGLAITWSLQLGPYAMSEGINNMDLDGVVFDFYGQVGDISVVADAWDRLNDAAVMDTETNTITTTEGLTDFRISGRYIGFTFGGSAVDGFMRFGKPTAFVKRSGRRK